MGVGIFVVFLIEEIVLWIIVNIPPQVGMCEENW